MSTPLPTEVAYTGNQPAGVIVLVVCSALSLVSVMGMFVVFWVSLVRSRDSSNGTVFVRTNVAIYFISLLILNILQAIGGLLNIPWLVANRVYNGVACTAQGVIKEISNVGTPIFCTVIAAHTFCLLFLRHKWSDRACYIVLVVSWALTVLEVCIEGLVLAKPKEIGPYFGLAGFWCYITAEYPIERFATAWLLMFLSAAICIILYLLIFFRLRGNITVSAGHKLSFHRRPKLKVGRTSDGTYVVTDDRRIESHLTKVAKHMLWYPIAYIIVVLPMGASRFSTFSGTPVPASVTIFAASLFMLHGLINTLLFCTTRNIVPERWRGRWGSSPSRTSARSDHGLSSNLANNSWRFTGVGTRTGVGATSVVVNVEKDVDIAYDAALRDPDYIKLGPLLPHNPPPLPNSAYKHYSRHISFAAPRDPKRKTHAEVERVDDGYFPGAGVSPATREMITEQQMPRRSMERAYSRNESGAFGPVPALTTLTETDTRPSPSSIYHAA